MADLDAPAGFVEFDPRGMLPSISGLPQQCEDAWRSMDAFEAAEELGRVGGVVVVGVGGSAIGAELVRTLVAPECPVPVAVHRDYVLPAYVGAETLVVVCSYSGSTEEALVGLESARVTGAQVVAITTGGELLRRAKAYRIPAQTYDYVTQPRAAIGYSLVHLLRLLQGCGLVRDLSDDVAEAVQTMRRWQAEIGAPVPVEQNGAKQLAQRLSRKLPVVYAAEHLAEVARRWKGQFNENSKSWAVFDVLPELNHNSVVGYPLPDSLTDLAHILLLVSSDYHPRVWLRVGITRSLLEKHGYAHDVIAARGEGRLAQMLSLVHFGDYVSYYLAMLYEVDPWAIGNIEFVKDRLRTSDPGWQP
jgi:glucose/mannose-6-phosphate isomerase